jgi:hypothetical protein
MQAFIEMTKWDDGKEYPHVYWMDDAKNKAYAYARWGNPNDTQVFKKPIQIDVRGRKFEPVQNIFTPKPQNPKIFQSEYFNDK